MADVDQFAFTGDYDVEMDDGEEKQSSAGSSKKKKATTPAKKGAAAPKSPTAASASKRGSGKKKAAPHDDEDDHDASDAHQGVADDAAAASGDVDVAMFERPIRSSTGSQLSKEEQAKLMNADTIKACMGNKDQLAKTLKVSRMRSEVGRRSFVASLAISILISSFALVSFCR
jgi:hypothetical protein